MNLGFRRGINRNLKYTYDGEIMAYETTLERGKGWVIVFRLSAQRYIVLKFMCLACRHRTSRRLQKARVTWWHYYIAPLDAKPLPHRICHCGCERPKPPSTKEEMKAYKRLAFWKHQFRVHRAKFFEGTIKKAKPRAK